MNAQKALPCKNCIAFPICKAQVHTITGLTLLKYKCCLFNDCYNTKLTRENCSIMYKLIKLFGLKESNISLYNFYRRIAHNEPFEPHKTLKDTSV
jgi:hypothetical protein